MADNWAEKRQSKRVRIRLSCRFQLNNGQVIIGRTQDVSYEGVFLEAQCSPQDPLFRSLKVGDLGILILRYSVRQRLEFLRIRCRIAHIAANGFGMHMDTARLSTADQKVIARILEAESDNL
jgi:hypothetical protein